MSIRSRTRCLAFILFSSAICGSIFITSCSKSEGQAGGRPSFGGARPPAVVSTVAVETGPSVVESRFVGTLSARAFADLYSKTSGQIVGVFADTGDRVKRGQLLARIDDAEAREGVDRSRAAIGMSNATLEQRRAALEVARAKARRTATLAERDLVSVEENEEAQANLLSAEAQLRLAEASLQQARANQGSAQLELDHTRIVAPFDGFVGKRYLDLGALAGTNRPVFSVVDLSIIETSVALTERDAARIDVGQPADITVDTFPGETFTGNVARMASVFDPDTHTTEAEIEVENTDGRLKPGMFAYVRIASGEPVPALLVPEAALIDADRKPYIFIAAKSEDSASGRPSAGPGGANRSNAGPGGAAGRPSGQPSGESDRGAGRGPTGDSRVARRVNVSLLGVGVRPVGEEDPSQRRIAVEPVGDPLREGDAVIVLGQEGLRDGTPVSLNAPLGRPANP